MPLYLSLLFLSLLSQSRAHQDYLLCRHDATFCYEQFCYRFSNKSLELTVRGCDTNETNYCSSVGCYSGSLTRNHILYEGTFCCCDQNWCNDGPSCETQFCSPTATASTEAPTTQPTADSTTSAYAVQTTSSSPQANTTTNAQSTTKPTTSSSSTSTSSSSSTSTSRPTSSSSSSTSSRPLEPRTTTYKWTPIITRSLFTTIGSESEMTEAPHLAGILIPVFSAVLLVLILIPLVALGVYCWRKRRVRRTLPTVSLPSA